MSPAAEESSRIHDGSVCRVLCWQGEFILRDFTFQKVTYAPHAFRLEIGIAMQFIPSSLEILGWDESPSGHANFSSVAAEILMFPI